MNIELCMIKLIWSIHVDLFIGENLKPLVPKQSDIVAVYSSTFEELLRGRVISIDGHNMIKCVMVDTGHIESIKSIDVFTLPNQFVPNKVSNNVKK